MNPREPAKARPSLLNSRVLRVMALLALSLATLSACGKDEKAPAAATTSSTASQLLSHVPAAAPYLAANLEPTPDDVIDSFLRRLEPLTASLQTELEKLKTELEANSETLDSDDKLALAVANEFNGKLNRAGMESLGFDLTAEKVLYSFNAFPVVRSSLSDATALRATVQRVLDNADIDAAPLDFQGKSYWKLAEEADPNEGGKVPPAIYIAILEDHLVAAIYPESAEAGLLPHLLGFEKPAQSDAAERLGALNSQYSFTPYGTGVIDFQMLADEFLKPDTLLSRTMAESGEDMTAMRDPVCASEIRGIISHTPRIVGGTTELTPNAFGGQYVLETDRGIAQELIALVAGIPAVSAATTRLLEFSIGLNVGQARDFFRSKVEAITMAPYQCSSLQDLNAQAQVALEQLNQPLPPLVNNFRGLRISLDQLSMDQDMPPSAEGLIAVHVDQPEMVVGMAQMFVPDLAELKLVKGEPPVALPASMIPVPDLLAFAALAESSIGIGVGAKSESELLPFLGLKGAGDGSFMSVNYDSAAFMEWTDSLAEEPGEDSMGEFEGAYDSETGEPVDESSAEEEHEEKAAADEISKAARKALQGMAGRSEFKMRFTPSGLVVDSRMTFK